METFSVYRDAEQEALRFKWIESEKAGSDLGESAIRRWAQRHWRGYLRARWLEHLQGKRFWVELDRGDFGLVRRRFQDNALLLDRILERLVAGCDNLDVILWAIEGRVPMDSVFEILEALDVNSRRLSNEPDSPARSDVPLVRIDPAWLAWQGGTVIQLARAIAQEGDLASLPVLGDALEDAGCADPVVLDHCRCGDRGLKWSWLVDLILWGP